MHVNRAEAVYTPNEFAHYGFRGENLASKMVEVSEIRDVAVMYRNVSLNIHRSPSRYTYH